MNTSLADKIKNIRIKKSMSQKELGSLLGISDRAVSKWENGLSKPSVENLFQLSKILNVSADYFSNLPMNDSAEKEAPWGMESVTELYKIGRGPSSSHTIGPEKACMILKKKNGDADKFRVILYGSLAKTG